MKESIPTRVEPEPRLKQLAEYLDTGDVEALRDVLNKVYGHLVEKMEKASYSWSTDEVEGKIITLRRIGRQTSLDDTKKAMHELTGTQPADIQELLRITKTFTETYNKKNLTTLDLTQGRDLLFQMARANALQEEAKKTGTERQEEMLRRQVQEYLKRNENVFQEADFADRLVSILKEAWTALPTGSGYIHLASKDEKKVMLYYKGEDSSFREIGVPTEDPFIIGGKEVTTAYEICRYLTTYAGLSRSSVYSSTGMDSIAQKDSELFLAVSSAAHQESQKSDPQ